MMKISRSDRRSKQLVDSGCRCYLLSTIVVLVSCVGTASGQQSPSREDAIAGLRMATRFMRDEIADHGGYSWVSSVDGQLREGEDLTPPGTIWNQPPGTPAIGMAFLEAYRATGEPLHLAAALDAAQALVETQQQSGGWNYRGEFIPERRAELRFRVDLKEDQQQLTPTPDPGGWEVWKQRRQRDNITVLDDNTTQSVLQFLMQVDRELDFANQTIHEAVGYALISTRNAQYLVGAWSHNYDQFPLSRPSEDHYPVLNASIPSDWPREWPKAYDGCYMINDRITLDMIRTMLMAFDVYEDQECLESALLGGDFLIRAQLPDPQPAWGQQYNRHMEPVWDRPFEPAAITGLESQDVIETLIELYRATREPRFLEPIEPALDYLESCLLDDGNLARYYELETSRAIFMTTDYEMTYERDDLPDHYTFVGRSKIERLRRDYLAARELSSDVSDGGLRSRSRPSADQVQAIIESQTADGAWPEPGTVRGLDGRKTTPVEGVIQSATFIRNMQTLSAFVAGE